jgi:hypothetical protein
MWWCLSPFLKAHLHRVSSTPPAPTLHTRYTNMNCHRIAIIDCGATLHFLSPPPLLPPPHQRCPYDLGGSALSTSTEDMWYMLVPRHAITKCQCTWKYANFIDNNYPDSMDITRGVIQCIRWPWLHQLKSKCTKVVFGWGGMQRKVIHHKSLNGPSLFV